MTKSEKRQVRMQDKPRRPDSERRRRQATRLGRCLKLLQLVQGRGRWNAKDLAAENQCSERTVFRDLDALALAGVPWYFDEAGKCYRVRSYYWFPALNLSDDELLGQAVAGSVTKAAGLDINTGAGPTTRRLVVMSEDRAADILDDAEELVNVFCLKLADHSRHRDMLSAVQWALVRRKQLVGQYESPYQERPVQLKLHPYRLCLVNQAWYVVGRATDRDAPHTYRVARFKSLRMVDAPAVRPTEFDLTEYFGNAWAVYRGDTSHQVVVRFDKEASSLVTETNWHPTQRVSRHKDGTVSLHFQVDGLEEIVHWVLGWTGRAEVVQPTELRDKVATSLRTALSKYE